MASSNGPARAIPAPASLEPLEERRLFAAAIVHQELHRPPTAVADFDGDGRADLARATVAPNAAGGVTVGVDLLRNNGDGSFSLWTHGDCDDTSSDGAVAVDVATGDLDGDGTPDVALKLYSVTGQPTPVGEATRLEARIVPMRVDPKGGLTTRKTFVVPHVFETRRTFILPHVLESSKLFIGDLDRDGFGDIVSVLGQQVVTARRTAAGLETTLQDSSFYWDGTMKGSARFVGLGDLDGDGRSDLVALCDGSVRSAGFDPGDPAAGTAPGFAGPRSIYFGTDPADNGWIAGVTADGSPNDLVVVTASGASLLLINDNAGNFTQRTLSSPVSGNPDRILVGDLDGDGADELFTVKDKGKDKGTGEGKKEWVGHVTLLK